MKIYENRWAGYKTYFICLGQNSTYAYGIKVYYLSGKWHVNKCSHYLGDIRNDREHFPIVGNINLKKLVIDAVLNEVSKGDKQ